jgi:CubicO group peptidase (beta-lactamase class C family)
MIHVDYLMKKAVMDRVFPGAVLLVSKDNRIEFFEAYGCADLFSGAPVTRDTLFDMASLTKPLATTLAVMQLMQQSRLVLDQPVVSMLPGFRDPRMSRVTVRHLLGHCSGLTAYRPFFLNLRFVAPAERHERLKGMLIEEKLVDDPGNQVMYSDIGFMILRWMVESITGDRLDHFVTQSIYRPLGLQRIHFMGAEQGDYNENIAATELCMWRNFLIKGTVHDDNAFIVGGIDGHAGLFGSAWDVASLITVLLSDYRKVSGGGFFDTELIRLFWSRFSPFGRALGFDMPSANGASCGRFFGKSSVGHLGFTGTSFWIDPVRSVFVVLLSNRVHPSRFNIEIRRFRPLIHDEIMCSMGVSG